jgi:hypothetical protein
LRLGEISPHESKIDHASPDILSSEIPPMKTLLALILGLTATLAHAEHYGAPISGKVPVSLAAAIQQADKSGRTDVIVESKVDKVCVVKGCWLGLTDASSDVRVTFKDYAFFVPASLVGKRVLVEGQLEKVTMSLEDTRHYVKDAGGDPTTVTQPRVEYRIVASGVQVKT